MRISDWSSDVCSSDLWQRLGAMLLEPSAGLRLGRVHIAMQPASVEEVAEGVHVSPDMTAGDDDLVGRRSVAGPAAIAVTPFQDHLERRMVGGLRHAPLERPAEVEDPCRAGAVQQIGRASCRERVCQYVLISVVGVQLKKKSNKQLR